MSEEAKKRAATAAKQARHAVANVEKAAELEAFDVAERVVEVAEPIARPIAKPFKAPAVQITLGSGLVVFSTIGVYHVGTIVRDKVYRSWQAKRDEKKVQKLTVVKEKAS